jgi:hypothetical protein
MAGLRFLSRNRQWVIAEPVRAPCATPEKQLDHKPQIDNEQSGREEKEDLRTRSFKLLCKIAAYMSAQEWDKPPARTSAIMEAPHCDREIGREQEGFYDNGRVACELEALGGQEDRADQVDRAEISYLEPTAQKSLAARAAPDGELSNNGIDHERVPGLVLGLLMNLYIIT